MQSMTITEIVGKKVMHGSPGYENQETIKQITITKEAVEIVFESAAFTTMSAAEFEFLLDCEELSYIDNGHGGMSNIIFSDNQEKWYSLID
jgi:hypothetical protein